MLRSNPESNPNSSS
jgi:hypothetical protein